MYFFDSSTYTTIDLTTMDSVKRLFSVPDSWEIKAVNPASNLVLAFINRQKSKFDSCIVFAGVWSMETGECLKTFPAGAHSWMDYPVADMEGMFLPDGNHVIIKGGGGYNYDTIGMALFDLTSGKKAFDYPIVKGVPDCALTPDATELLVGMDAYGIYCFDALSGSLLRFYRTPYTRVPFLSAAFPMNPAHPRQFIAGNKIWELPAALSVHPALQKTERAPMRVLSATPQRLLLSLPARATQATLKIYQSNGRMIAQSAPGPGDFPTFSLALPGLAPGLYLYRFDAVEKALCGRGVFMVP